MFEDSVLFTCHCGSEYTHFAHVVMFARPLGEDEVVEAITVDKNGNVSRRLLERSSEGAEAVYETRRQQVHLVGMCEDCGLSTVMRFRQYKGQTFIDTLYEEA